MTRTAKHKKIRDRTLLLMALIISPLITTAQEVRTGLEYHGEIARNIIFEPGVETRYFRPYSMKPNRLIFDLSAGYKFNKHWKLKSGLRYRTGNTTGEAILSNPDDKNRITFDAYYKKINNKKTGTFQARVRYQLSEGKREYKDFYRLRLKWEHMSNKDFNPFFSTEVIYSKPELVPHSFRLRAGMDIRTSKRTGLDLFYQVEIYTKEKHDIMHFVLGCRLNLYTK